MPLKLSQNTKVDLSPLKGMLPNIAFKGPMSPT